MIYDKVYFLKNINSMMHRAAKLLYAEEKLFLTGTSIIDRLVDLVYILQFSWWGD